MAGNGHQRRAVGGAAVAPGTKKRQAKVASTGGLANKKSRTRTSPRKKGNFVTKTRKRDLTGTPPSVLITATAPATTAGGSELDSETILHSIEDVRGLPRYLDYSRNSGWTTISVDAGEECLIFCTCLYQPVDNVATCTL
jgi:hypothetical protein